MSALIEAAWRRACAWDVAATKPGNVSHASAGHRMTAFELYYKASAQFAAAQHPVLETNDEKRYLHGRCIANYEKVMELCYRFGLIIVLSLMGLGLLSDFWRF